MLGLYCEGEGEEGLSASGPRVNGTNQTTVTVCEIPGGN